MKYIIDHDYHIHSNISGCADDPAQTPSNILKYAEDTGLKKIVLTDHFWDEDSIGDKRCVWRQYESSSFKSIKSALPLPQSDSVEFVFGCEADIDEEGNIGIHPDHYDEFGFIAVATAHMHMWYGKEVTIPERKKLYLDRFATVLESNLPFKKVGIAHPTDGLIANLYPGANREVLNLISDNEFYTLFRGAKDAGCGIELNGCSFSGEKDLSEEIMRPYFIAKDCGCKFYIGNDAHVLSTFVKYAPYSARAVEVLGLTEDDKFHF